MEAVGGAGLARTREAPGPGRLTGGLGGRGEVRRPGGGEKLCAPREEAKCYLYTLGLSWGGSRPLI